MSARRSPDDPVRLLRILAEIRRLSESALAASDDDAEWMPSHYHDASPDSIENAFAQDRAAHQDEEDLAAATRASFETSYNEVAEREREEKRRAEIEEYEKKQQQRTVKNKRKNRSERTKSKRTRPHEEIVEGLDNKCAVCCQDLENRRNCGVFPQCGHSQFHDDCAKKSYEANGRCPLCNLGRGVPIALL